MPYTECMPRQQNAYPLRMPDDLREALEEESKDQSRTLHAQILFTLRKGMEDIGRLPKNSGRKQPDTTPDAADK